MRNDMPRLIVEPFLPHGHSGDPAVGPWLGSFTLARLVMLVVGVAAIPPMLIARDLFAPLMPVVLTMVAVAALGLAGVRFGRPQDALALTGAGMLVLAVGPWPDGLAGVAAMLAACALGAEWLAAPRIVRQAHAASATLVIASAAVLAASGLRSGTGISAGPALLLLVLPLMTMALTLAAQSNALARTRQGIVRPDHMSATALAAARSAVLVVNRQAELKEASPGVNHILETTGQALSGRDFLDRILIADRPALLKAVSDVAAGGTPATLSIRVATGRRGEMQAGPPSFASLHATIEPAGAADVVAIVLDIPPSADAGGSDLFGSEAQLAALAHDIRSPMNAILGFSALLADRDGRQPDGATVAEYGCLIHAAANTSFAMTAAVLDGIRLDTLAPAPVERIDLGEVVAGLTATHANRMRLGHATRTVRVPSEATDVSVDPQLLRMLVANLVDGLGSAAGADGTVEAQVVRTGATVTVTWLATPGAGRPLTASGAHLEIVEGLARRLAVRLDGTFASTIASDGATVRLVLPAAPRPAVRPAPFECVSPLVPLLKRA